MRMIDKAALRKEQLAYIDFLLSNTGKNLTEIAKDAGLAPTTLTRFYNNKNHKYCLSATTLAMIKAKFSGPPEKSETIGANDNREDSEIAVSFALQLILKVLLAKKMVTATWLEDNLILAQSHYRKHRLPNAALLIGELLASVLPEAPQKGRLPSRQPLGLEPLALR